MHGKFTLGGGLIAVAGLATLCLSLAAVDPPMVRSWQANVAHPVAALAWAQSNCASDLQLVPGTPRLQAEDFLTMTGDLAALDAQRGRKAACSAAIAAARDVAVDRAGLAAPQASGEVASVK